MRRGVSVVIVLLSLGSTAASTSAASTDGPLLLEGPVLIGQQMSGNAGSPASVFCVQCRVDAPKAAGGPMRRNEIVAAVERMAPAYDIDPALVTAIIETESAFHADAVSPK